MVHNNLTQEPVVKASFEVIDIERIYPDQNQPREFFDDDSLKELADSIRENGLLQPIMVRPNGNILLPSDLEGPSYKIVCGGRRYRAAVAVGLKEIPAVIRDLSDDQALEIQIVENLQRKDVNPMEEALAFSRLHRRFKLEEIAARVGKSVQYVAQRLKLVDLIEPFQELVYAHKMTLVTANKLCRFTEDVQQELYKEARVPKDWKKKKDYVLDQFYSLESKGEDLDQAPFKTEDPDLYPEMGACNKCPHNSAANKILFPDMKSERICHNPACFHIKTGRSYTQTIEKALSDPEMLFVSLSSYPDKEEKAKIKAVQDLGATVLERDQVEVIYQPTELKSWEEFLAEQKDDYDFEEMNEKEQKESLKEWEADYRDMKEEDEQEWKEYNEAISSGKIKKAFVVTGHYEGKEIDVVFRAGKGGKIEVNENSTDDTKILAIQQEIASIKERENRNKELDREKVYKKLSELIKNSEGSFLINDRELSGVEQEALLYALAQHHQVRDMVQESLGQSFDYHGKKLFTAIQTGKIKPLLNRACRHFIVQMLVDMNNLDPERQGKAAAIYSIATEYVPAVIEAEEIAQRDKALKRQASVTKRTEALQKQLTELKASKKDPVNTASHKPSKSGKKK